MSSPRRRRLNTDQDATKIAPTTESAAIWDAPRLFTDAAPRVEMWARSMADAAAELEDIARPGGWNQSAAEDALDAFEFNAQALETIHPDAREVLVVARRVVAELRRLGHLPDPDEDGLEAPPGRGRRHGLGPGWLPLRESAQGEQGEKS